jgi:hypothetical protein
MAYYRSSHFSDWKTYKIHFNPSYGLGDMILARTTPFLQKQKKRERTEEELGSTCLVLRRSSSDAATETRRQWAASKDPG